MPFSWRNPKTRDSIERRRERGEISCAECRRLKLKCNKTIPCSTCVRKGCPEICPNGTLTPANVARHGSRNKDLRAQKLVQMSRRIRELEDALQIAHGSMSASQHHPLLSEDLLKIKNDLDQPRVAAKGNDDADEDFVNSFGTLSILDRGIETYIGADESVLKLGAVGGMQYRVYPSSWALPASYPSQALPFNPLCLPPQEIQEQIEEKLPSLARASALVEAYLENTSWFVKLIDREQIVEELLPLFYKRRGTSGVRGDAHTLSLLFAIFACGAVADFTLPPWNEEADLYYQLAWTTFGLRSMFEGTTLQTIQALAVIGSYDIFSCRRNSLEGTCKMIGYCMSLAVSIGLHRDPTHFNLPPKQVRRRRILFWGLHTMDAWKSVGTGRPMTIHRSSIDCEIPEDTDAATANDGSELPSVWAIQYRFSKEAMADVVDKLSSARSLKYSEILDVDLKIREFGQSKACNVPEGASSDGSTRGALRKLLMMLIKESPLLLLHRNFFVRALIENPTDPTKSRFAPSFLTAYSSAVKMLRAIRELLNDCANFVTRIWPVWSHALSASVLLGSVAACGSASALAPQAFTEFNIAVSMLEGMQIHPIVKELMPAILHLRQRACEALGRPGNNGPAPQSSPEKAVREATNNFANTHTVGVMPSSASNAAADNMSNDYSYVMNQLPFSSSTTTPSPDFLRGGVTAQHSPTTRGHEALTHPPSHGHANTMPNGSISTSGRPLNGSPSSRIVGDSRDLSYHQSSLLYSAVGGIARLPQLQAIDPAALQGPSGGLLNGHNHAPVQAMPSELLHPPDSLDNLLPDSGFDAHHPGLANGERTAGTQARTSPSPFNFDSLSTLPPESFFDTDFDVSYNMRSSTGDESILPLISEDLAPCRTILEDSRFFGYGFASDQDAQSGFGMF